jgi:hypothetical protein
MFWTGSPGMVGPVGPMGPAGSRGERGREGPPGKNKHKTNWVFFTENCIKDLLVWEALMALEAHQEHLLVLNYMFLLILKDG